MKVKLNNKLVMRGMLLCLTVIAVILSIYVQAAAADPDVFAQEAGNQFTYAGTEVGHGSYTLVETVYLDTVTFSPDTTYRNHSVEDGYEDEGDLWYEKGSGVLKLRGLRFWDDEDGWLTFRFASGLPMAWYPMKSVGYHEYNSTTTTVDQAPGLTFNASLDVTVMSIESVALGFGTLEAYKMRYVLTASGHGEYMSFTLYEWLVPYIGNIKYKDAEMEELLTTFNIGGGVITQATDTDGDGLKDYRELAVYNTNRESTDTEGDQMPDGWEVQYGLNPTVNDASLDKDGDGFSNLQEYQAGTDPTDPDSKPHVKAMPFIPLLLDEN